MSEAAPEIDETAETRQALGLLSQAVVACAAVVLVTYFVPALSDQRPWAPGDPAPFSTLFGGNNAMPEFAGAGYQAGPLDDAARERLGDDVGDAVAQNLTDDGDAPDAPTPPPAEGAPLRIDETAYEGLARPLEDEGHRGMAAFYRVLADVHRGREGAMARVAHYGDSSIATDRITSTVRRRLQRRFGDGGHGFVLASKAWLPYRHLDLTHVTNHERWSVREVTRRSISSGRYGFAGNVVRARPGARARFGPELEAPVGNGVSRFEIWYPKQRRGGRLSVEIDGEERPAIEMVAETTSDAVEVYALSDGDHTLRIRHAGGLVELYGVVLERPGPGVVYDSLGLVGARANRLLNFDAEHIRAQIARRGTNLLVLGFGGNEASDSIVEARYEEDFRQVIRHMRGEREDLACLIVAPMDQAERRGGAIRTFRSVPRIVRAQRRAAAAEGCAFFDTFEAMGGAGAMARWYRSRPALALSDFRHATDDGYLVIGNMLHKAILAGYAAWLREGHAD